MSRYVDILYMDAPSLKKKWVAEMLFWVDFHVCTHDMVFATYFFPTIHGPLRTHAFLLTTSIPLDFHSSRPPLIFLYVTPQLPLYHSLVKFQKNYSLRSSDM